MTCQLFFLEIMRTKQFLFIALSAVDSYVVLCNGLSNDKVFVGQNQSQTIGGNRTVYILLSSDDPEWIPCGIPSNLSRKRHGCVMSSLHSTGVPNENIVQNHLNIALLNVF